MTRCQHELFKIHAEHEIDHNACTASFDGVDYKQLKDWNIVQKFMACS
jgi:hypothetical protein